jgi:hypothetical protein
MKTAKKVITFPPHNKISTNQEHVAGFHFHIHGFGMII